MPLRTESYAYDDLHPIFQMNMPEGHLRNAIEQAPAKQLAQNHPDFSPIAETMEKLLKEKGGF